MKKILKLFYMVLFRFCWRKNNKHNETTAASRFNKEKICVGKNTYGALRIMHYNKDARLTIGSYCSIADNVTFLLGGEHDYRRITSYPFNSKIYHTQSNNSSFKNGGGYDITVGDDVWIGYGTTILSGVTIGTGTIIGAGSIVAKDIPPYSVFVGNRVIKSRFTKNIVDKLIGIDWEKVSHHKGDCYEKFVNTNVDENNIDEVLYAFLK